MLVWTKEARYYPHHCALTGRGATEDQLLDCGSNLPGIDPRLYLHAEGVKLIALASGYVLKADLDAVEEANRDLVAENERLREELVEAERFAMAVDVIESKDFTARRKRGRPKTPEVAA